jgi:hypothetical protein
MLDYVARVGVRIRFAAADLRATGVRSGTAGRPMAHEIERPDATVTHD